MRKKALSSVILTLVVVAIVQAKLQQSATLVINQGFFKSEEFLHMSQAQREGFAAGLVDGIYLAPLMGAPEQNIEHFNKCVTGMSSTQVAAIIEKFLKEHPEMWHQFLNVEAYNALFATCRELTHG